MAAPPTVGPVLPLPAIRNGWLTNVRFCAHNGIENEMAFAHGCICSGRRRSDFASDQVEASNTAFLRRRGRMEMQQVGVDPNDLRAQPRGPLFSSMN